MNKVGVIITTFNRPEYLRECLHSIKMAELSLVSTIMIMDDASNDKETIQLIKDFDVENINVIKFFKKENKSIKHSLLIGLDALYPTTDLFINLDSDAIISKDFFTRLLALKEEFSGNLVTGFNCTTKNKNGSVRHHILSEGPNWNKKKTVGGINLVFSQTQYLEWIKPALEKCLKNGGNWDQTACLISFDGYGKEVVCAVPSACQHIGFDSAMGHSAGGEPPDIAEDFIYDTPKDYGTRLYVSQRNDGPGFAYDKAKLHIPSVTLIAVDDNIDAIIKAADISCRMIKFGAVKLLSSKDSADARAIKIRHLGSKKEYGQFILKELAAFVETPYALIVQGDGYVINWQAWRDYFLNYDAVGAVWDFRDHKKTCNGGFCIRSKKLLDITANDPSIYLQNDSIINNYAEDHVLFYIYREYLEGHHGIKIAPEEVCHQFSIEVWGRKDKTYKGSFGFHGYGIDFSKSNLQHKPY
jgi:glycosyltransferase involved in cell wall biosynthesis